MRPLLFFILLLLAVPAHAGEQLDYLKRVLLESARRLHDGVGDPRQTIGHVCRQLAIVPLTDDEVSQLLQWSRSEPEIEIIPQTWDALEVAQEIRDARRGGGPEFGAWMLSNELSTLVRPRVEDRILFVGSGPLPSGTYMREMTEARIALCDCDARALEMSRRLIQKKGWESRFDFVHCSVHEINDVSAYTLIWIATMVPDKYRALDALAKTITPGTRVIVRQPVGTKQIFIRPYEDLSSHPSFFAEWATEYQSCQSLLLKAR